jgi:siroheme synthase
MSARPGVVYLVGAGPGDPGLMTVRSLELIATADTIFYDRLIPPGALHGARPDAELIYVGKTPPAGLCPPLGGDNYRRVRVAGGDQRDVDRGGSGWEERRAAQGRGSVRLWTGR